MAKRLIAMVLVLALTLSILPLALVSAEAEAVTASPKAGTHTHEAHSDDCGVTDGWQEWTKSDELPTFGKYILTQNVTVTGETVLTDDLTLCLNGYVIKSSGTNRILSTKKDADTTLTICDCTAYTENGVYHAGALTGGKRTSDGGAAIFVRRGGTLKFYDGRVTGNVYQSNTTSVGGTVMLQAKSNGLNAKAFIYGGEFSNNKSVMADGVSARSGDKIASGGVIYVGTDAELTITGGTFKDNWAGNGGAIYGAQSVVKISGATFTGNTAAVSGSVLHNNGAMNLTIGDGTVMTGNIGTSTGANNSYAAAVSMVGSAGKLTLTGKVYIANNTVPAKGVASIAFDKAASDTLYVKELAAGSYVEFSTPKTEPAAAGDVIEVADAQSSWNNGWVVFMDKNGARHHVGKDANGFKFVEGHFHENVEFTAVTSADQLIAGGNYYLADDFKLTKAVIIPDGVETSICLNGQTLTSSYTSQATFQTKNNDAKATFNIYDCTAYTDAEGVYHAGTFSGIQNKSTGHGGIFMIRNSGTLNFYDGRFENCTAANSGGAIFANGTLNVYRAEFKNCKALKDTTAKPGGAVFVNASAKAVIKNAAFTGNSGSNAGALAIYGAAAVKNCTFTGNTATNGGAVYIMSTKAVSVDGCSVTGNTTTGTSGAFVVDAGTNLTMKNQVVVSGNTGGDLMMGYEAGKAVPMLDVAGLVSGSEIVVAMSDARVTAGELVFTTASDSNNNGYFTSGMDKYVVERNEDKQLQLVKTAAPVHKHTLCNDSGCTEHTAQVEYQAWTDGTTLPDSGSWYLDTDVEMTKEVRLATAGTLNLCLNGHTIKGYTSNSNAHAYSTTANVAVTLNISDCSAARDASGNYTAGKFTGFVNTHTDGGGAAIHMRAGSTLNFFDGIIENGAAAAGGGAFYAHTATAIMWDGLLTNNQAISGETRKNGGAVALYKGSFVMHGGEISGNQAFYGGGVYLFDGDSSFEMTGGKITGNTATGGSAGVHAAYTAAVTKISGDAYISGNTLADGSANNLRLGNSGNIIVGQLGANALVGITLGNTVRAFSNVVDSDLSAQFPSDSSDYVTYLNAEGQLAIKSTYTHIHCQCGKADCTDASHAKIEYQPWDDATKLPGSGNYCLMTDVTVSAEVSVKADLNLCLHGHTINGFTADGARAYSTVANTAVTINVADCTTKTVDGVYTAGKFIGFNNTHMDSGGAAIYVRAGSTLNFYDGIVDGCNAASGGGAFYAHTSTINMYGGLLTNNTAIKEGAMKNGAGVFLYKGTFNMYDGEISGNEAAYGSGVYLFDSTSRFNISGGKITGNIAHYEGAGVNAALGATLVNISGNAYILGNTTTSGAASNLRLGKSGKISVADLAADAKIGVTASSRRAISEATADYTAQIVSDDVKTVVIYKDGALYMDSASDHRHCLCAGDATGCTHEAEAFDPWDDATTLPTSGSYYLTVDVQLTEQSRVEKATLNLCLNGHTISAPTAGGRVFYMTNGGKLSITDCVGTGKLTGATKGAILSNAEGTDMQLNLYAGTITDNHSTGSGGALVLQGGMEFNMYGGTIADNTTTSHLNYDEKGEIKLDKDGNQSATASYGAGIYASEGVTINMYDGKITNNIATKVSYLKADGSTATTGGNGGGIYLTKAVANLYGGEISNNQANLGGGVILFGAGAELNLMGADLTGNKATCGGAAISQTNAVINMSAGSISGNIATINGAGVYVSTGTTMNLTGGELTKNTTITDDGAWKTGGAIYLLASTLNMTGGTIADNEAAYGAGIAMGTSGGRLPALNISGGKITGNIAHYSGAGINATYTGETITISGNAYIFGNVDANGKASNLRLGKTCLIHVVDLTADAKIGVTATSRLPISGATEDCTAQVITDDDKMVVTYKDGVLYMDSASTHWHCLCVNAATTGCDHAVEPFDPWDDPTKLPTSGNYYLTVDVQLTEQSRVEKATLNLCLNGHTISAPEAGGRVFYMTNGAILNITDCQGGGKLTGATKGAILSNEKGTDMQLNLYGGSITGNHSRGSGGALVLQGDLEFNMYGGTIADNTTTSHLNYDEKGEIKLDKDGNQSATASYGAGIYASEGVTINMYDGKITNNIATKVSYLKADGSTATTGGNGGGIYLTKAVANLYGGEISNNQANLGGGVILFGAGAELNLMGADLTGNKATCGGAAISQTNAVINMSAGSISGNIATTNGAGVYVSTGTTMNLTGGELTKNTTITDDGAWKTGGAIYLLASTLNMTGGIISDNEAAYGAGIAMGTSGGRLPALNISGGKITGNIAHYSGAGINATYTGETITISGNAYIFGNVDANGKASNLRLGKTCLIHVTDLAETAKVGVTATTRQAFSTKTLDYTKQIVSDDSKNIVIYKDETLYLDSASTHWHCVCAGTTKNGCDHANTQFDEWDDPTKLPTSGNYYLSVDVKLTGAQSRVEKGTLNLCLNGHTITASESSGRVFYMTNGGKLSITDCQGGGKLTGATKGAILTNAAGEEMELNLYGGIITDNHASSSGAGLVIQGDCVFNMYGGKITGNTITSMLVLDENDEVVLDSKGNQKYKSGNGGGLYTGTGTTFNMYGGEISNNSVTKVTYVKADGTTKTVGGYGGGVACYSTANLYGGKISNNQGYLGGGVFITGAGSNLNLMGTEISGNHANAAGGGLISQTHSVVNLSAGEVKNNTCNSAGAGMYISTGTTLNMTGGKVTGNVGSDGTNFKSGAGMYLLASTANISGGEISYNKGYSGSAICAGTSGTRVSTINLSGDFVMIGNEAAMNGTIFCTGEGAKITMSGGTITGNKAANAGGIITQGKSSFEMSGGTITKNAASSGGGGVYISTNTTFTMTGGKISGNTSKGDGGGLTILRATASLKGGTISGNTGANGGGIKINGGKVTFSGTKVVSNNAVGKFNTTTGKISGGNGGGIMLGRASYKKDGVQKYECPVITIHNIYLAYNQAHGAAGGMLIQSDGTVFNMYSATVCYNKAPNSAGGGIYFSTKSRPNVYGATYYGNEAKNAAAFYILNTTGVMENIKVYNNQSTSSNVIVTGAQTVIEAKNIEIYDNVSTGSVGGIAIQGGATFNLQDAKIHNNTSGNTGGGVYFSTPGFGTWKNVEIYENTVTEDNAGGVFIGQSSRVTFENVTIRDNVANGAFGGGVFCRGRLDIIDSKILNNQVTAGVGGGMATSTTSNMKIGQDAGLYATNCIISGNKAADQGGGVYGHRGGPVYLENCTITDNEAGMEGGGAYADGRFGMIDTTVTGNTSGGEGFAVYFTASEFDGQSYTTGHKKIGGNMIIKDNEGGNFYLGERSAVAVVGGPLGEKSYMEITLHSGVLSEHLIGVYNYEGGDLKYIVTAGDRSLTDPEKLTVAHNEAQTDSGEKAAAKTNKTKGGNVLLYVGMAVLVIAIAVVAVLIAKKKKTPAGEKKN